jgi:hypothetical protein
MLCPGGHAESSLPTLAKQLRRHDWLTHGQISNAIRIIVTVASNRRIPKAKATRDFTRHFPNGPLELEKGPELPIDQPSTTYEAWLGNDTLSGSYFHPKDS